MKGVAIPGVSAGSNQVGASVMWTAHVIWPAGASARPSDAATAAGATLRTSASASNDARRIMVTVSDRLGPAPHHG